MSEGPLANEVQNVGRNIQVDPLQLEEVLQHLAICWFKAILEVDLGRVAPPIRSNAVARLLKERHEGSHPDAVTNFKQRFILLRQSFTDFGAKSIF